ncbi:MAG: Flp family type IVb pilin [Hyphomicrobiaceae bacterium]|nr:Flp family type IVb pilin [Hyphomicrobiaceae bacterium]
MRSLLKTFCQDDAGATSIEYGMIAAFIAIAIITVLQQIGTEVQKPFEDVESGLKKRPA